MSAGGSHKNLGSKVNKMIPQQRKRSLAFIVKRSNVYPLFYIAFLFIAWLSCTHSKAFQAPFQRFNSFNRVFPLQSSFTVYVNTKPFGFISKLNDGENSDVDHTDGVVEDTPVKGSNPDVSTAVGYNSPNIYFRTF